MLGAELKKMSLNSIKRRLISGPAFASVVILALVAVATGALPLLSSTGADKLGQETSRKLQTISVPKRVTVFSYEVVRVYPHDRGAFTQGLVYHNGFLYESTGLEGQSTLRKVDLNTGQVLQRKDIARPYFAEGLAIRQGRAFQLTWLSEQGFVYDLESFNLLKTFNYFGQGWGLTNDAHSLIMSNGSNTISFLDPETLSIQRSVSVLENSQPLNNLNELEYINGEIFANVWQTNRIVRIDPANGNLRSWIDMSGLLSPEDRLQPVDVLNGIAFDPATGRIFVTGKLWPKLFEIKIIENRKAPRRN